MGKGCNPDGPLKTDEYRVGRIATADLGTLAAHRALPGWSMRSDGPAEFWLRVPMEDEEIFRKLPLSGRWAAGDDRLLVRDGRFVPEAVLPSDGWVSPATIVSVTPPARGGAGMPPPAIAFQLEPVDADHPARALICQARAFAEWAETAFAPRLDRLRFAVCEDGRAFITGHPLPAMAGSTFYQLGRLWLPCGYGLPDYAWPELIEESQGLGRNRMAIFQRDGSFEEVDEENLVPVTRAAVRTTISGTAAS